MAGAGSRSALLAATVAVLLVTTGGVAESCREACSSARFIEYENVPLLGADFPGTSVITLQGTQITLGECGTVTARIRPARRDFSLVKAKWAPCAPVPRVKIKATIYEPCQFFVGVVRPTGLRAWKFRAENPDRLR